MHSFDTLLIFNLKRRFKDFFVLFYNIVFPAITIVILGYLTSASYGTVFKSYHYYTIVIIPFCSLMGITTVAYAAQDEKLMHTSYRYIAAPISIKAIVFSKYISCAVTMIICNSITLLVAAVIFKIDFSGKFYLIILLLACETLMVTGIGLLLGLAYKNFTNLQNFLNIPIVLFGFWGGAFFPIGSFNTVFAVIIKASPLTWINRSIVLCMYDNQTAMLKITSVILFLTGLIAVLLTVRFFKKEAFI